MPETSAVAKWFIEALDPRGGLAFATLRNFTLLDHQNGFSEAPCLFMAAPAFQTVPVASRALAWSAARASFQIGLFHDGQEVKFDSVGEIREFVRRTYLRSGGGSEHDGGGSPLPPLPRDWEGDAPPSSPEFPEAPSERRSKDGHTIDAFQALTRFHMLATKGPWQTHDTLALWGGGTDDTTTTVTAAAQPVGRALIRAANILMRDMLRRLQPLRNIDDVAVWRKSAESLGRALSCLNLWPWLVRQIFYPKDLLDPQNYAAASVRNLMNKIREWRPHSFAVLFGPDPDTPTTTGAWSTDPLPELARIPLPPAFAGTVTGTPPDALSLAHFLNAAVGAPQTLLDGHPRGYDALCLLLFAAARVVTGNAAAQPTSLWWHRTSPLLHEIQEHQLEELGTAAWRWLAQSLPHVAFPPALERHIVAASALRLVQPGRTAMA